MTSGIRRKRLLKEVKFRLNKMANDEDERSRAVVHDGGRFCLAEGQARARDKRRGATVAGGRSSSDYYRRKRCSGRSPAPCGRAIDRGWVNDDMVPLITG